MGEAPFRDDVLQCLAGWRDSRSYLSDGGKLWLVDHDYVGIDLVRGNRFDAILPAQVVIDLNIFSEPSSIASLHPRFSRSERNN